MQHIVFRCYNINLLAIHNFYANLFYLLLTEHLSIECKVFIHYYSQIVNTLSAITLSPYFVKHGIILPANQQEIYNVHSPTKAAGLLLSNISSALMSGFNKGFYKFLDITEQYGSGDSKHVTTAIKEKLLELKSEDKGTY